MTSSNNTPVWGPQKPRIERLREQRYYTTAKYFGGQSRNGITHAVSPWNYTLIRPVRANVERIKDTIRNPKFKKFAPSNFVDDGGPLLIQKSKWTFNDVNLVTPWRFNNRFHYGLIAIDSLALDGAIPMKADYPPDVDSNLSSFHALAYKALRPDKPAVPLLNSVLELRDLIHVKFNAIKNLKDIGDYWLAVNFGWLPLFNDILDLYKACINLEDRLRYFVRNNGKPIRASKEIWSDSSSSIIYQVQDVGISRNTWVDFDGRSSLNSAWNWTVSKTYSRKIWASGQFVFWMKDIELPKTQKRLQMGLLGLNPTPSVVWNAIPWTWLIDWFTNVGDILSNMSSDFGNRLVTNYAYVMGETKRSYTWHGTDGWFTCSTTHSYETKAREIMHPYGLAFGSNLTPFQLSILASLGSQRF